jgi:F-type H+-transporting ATPase subunit delta
MGELQSVETDLNTLHTLIESSREFELLLVSPVIKPDKKKSVLEALLKGGVSEITFRFINLLVSKGRENVFPSIVKEALAQLRIMNNIQAATVKTASTLDDDSKARVLAEVAKLHDGEVELTEIVDPSLIGGFILRMDDKEIDASIKRQLSTLRRKLTEHDYEPEF